MATRCNYCAIELLLYRHFRCAPLSTKKTQLYLPTIPVQQGYFVGRQAEMQPSGCKKLPVTGETIMMAPAAGFYGDPTLGKNQVRLAYVLKKRGFAEDVDDIGKSD